MDTTAPLTLDPETLDWLTEPLTAQELDDVERAPAQSAAAAHWRDAHGVPPW